MLTQEAKRKLSLDAIALYNTVYVRPDASSPSSPGRLLTKLNLTDFSISVDEPLPDNTRDRHIRIGVSYPNRSGYRSAEEVFDPDGLVIKRRRLLNGNPIRWWYTPNRKVKVEAFNELFKEALTSAKAYQAYRRGLMSRPAA